jgi:hypothetical protein
MLRYKDITVDEVREAFDYNEETGELIWKIKPCKKVGIGVVAGSYDKNGYRRLGYKSKNYFIHRLVWAYVHGKFPPNDIDHIDGNPANNKIGNLRAVSHEENLKNSKLHKNNTSGVAGVSKYKSLGWIACIGISGKKVHLGCFDDFFEACCARKSAESKYGYYPNHGRQP